MNIPERPAISVITCLYNTPPNLFEECLKGLVNQTFTDFEVLIVNDGSDKYLEENKALIEKLNDARFKYFDTEHTGKSQTLNYALKIAEGKYIAINDAGDVSYTERLEYQYNFLETHNDYDAIFNTITLTPSYVILPGLYESEKINNYNLNYLGRHVCIMVNSKSLREKVNLYVSQIYDPIYDNVFNFILFYSGLEILFDSTSLVMHNSTNDLNIYVDSYYKEALYKLYYNTFNCGYQSPNFTVIILYNESWNTELERTILNIRLTSNNVKILIIDFSKEHKDLEFIKKYNVYINIDTNTYINALTKGFELCDTANFLLLSKPIRFYNQNWDMYLTRKFEHIYQYEIIQPYMFSINKMNDYTYENEHGNIEYDIRKGLELQLLTKELTHSKQKLDLYSNDSFLSKTPILDEDMIFAGKTSLFKDLSINNILKEHDLVNVFISLLQWLNGYHINIDTEFKCGVIDNHIKTDINEIDYYLNLYKFVQLFLHETKFLYDKIIVENIKKSDYDAIVKKCENDYEFNNFKLSYTPKIDMSDFLKNINMRYNLWVQ